MDDRPLTKVHVDLPNHWAVGGESMWARELGAGRYRIENVPFYAYGVSFHDVVEARPLAPDLEPEASVEAVRDQLDRWEAAGTLAYETCEARMPGSFDSAPDGDADA